MNPAGGCANSDNRRFDVRLRYAVGMLRIVVTINHDANSQVGLFLERAEQARELRCGLLIPRIARDQPHGLRPSAGGLRLGTWVHSMSGVRSPSDCGPSLRPRFALHRSRLMDLPSRKPRECLTGPRAAAAFGIIWRILSGTLLPRHGTTANGMARPCSPRPGVNCQRGERRIGALLCHGAQICQLPPWALISARIHFTSSAWISVARSSCARDGRAARSEPGWRTCRLV